LNIQNKNELKVAFNEIIQNAGRYNSSATIAGVLVQKMVPKGIELIFGIKKDPVFGHHLVIGLGGTLVEIMKDFTMRMMPVSESDIEDMLKELKSYPMLKGYRGQPGIEMKYVKYICLGLNKLIQKKPEIDELDLNPVIFTGTNAIICDVRILMNEEKKEKKKRRSLLNMEKMLNPQSIAIVGVSQNEKKNGGRLFRYLVENKYPGKLYPINPGAKEIKGYKVYPDLKDVPDEIDLACIIVSATLVPDVLRSCVKKGVKAAIIYSSGFAEIGEEGELLQQEILAIAEAGDIRILGPNSIGIASPSKQIYTAFGAALESKVKLSGNSARGRPNCSLSLTCSTDISKAACASARDLAAFPIRSILNIVNNLPKPFSGTNIFSTGTSQSSKKSAQCSSPDICVSVFPKVNPGELRSTKIAPEDFTSSPKRTQTT